MRIMLCSLLLGFPVLVSLGSQCHAQQGHFKPASDDFAVAVLLRPGQSNTITFFPAVQGRTTFRITGKHDGINAELDHEQANNVFLGTGKRVLCIKITADAKIKSGTYSLTLWGSRFTPGLRDLRANIHVMVLQ